MRHFYLFMRQSFALFGGLLVFVVSFSLPLVTLTPGLKLWPDLVNGLSVASVYNGVVVSGIAAYEAAKWRTNNLDRVRLSSKSQLAIQAQHLCAIVMAQLVGFVLAVVALTIYAQINGFYGSPSIPWLGAIAAALVISAVFGYVIGFVLGTAWFVPPLVAVGYFFTYMMVRASALPNGIKAMYPSITENDHVFVKHLNSAMYGQIMLWLGLSLLLLLLVTRSTGIGSRVQPSMMSLGGLAIAIAIGGAGTLVVSNGQYTTGYNSRDFSCEGQHVVICLNKGYQAAYEPLSEAIDYMNLRVAGTPVEARLLEQNVEGYGDEPSPNARSIYLEQLDTPNDISFVVERYLQAYGSPNCIFSTGSEATVNLFVNSWLSDSHFYNEAIADDARYQSLLALDAKEGAEWFKKNYAKYASCDLKFKDLP